MYKFMDNYAKYSYEQLQLQQPHTNPQGIYKKGLEYFIKCGNLDVKPINNSKASIVEVFDNEIRVLGCKIALVDSVPIGATQLETRTIEQVASLSGNPLNVVDLNKQLVLLLPKDFPKLWIDFNHASQGWDAKIERRLLDFEVNILEKKVSQLCGYETTLTCMVDMNVKRKFEHKYQDPLSITVSKHSLLNYSKPLLQKWEEDEQLWSDMQEKLFISNENLKVENDKVQQSACFINGRYGEAHNIRNYLTLFNEIQIVVPNGSMYEKLLHSLDITEDDLIKLVEMNRVKLIFPHTVESYNKSLLEKVTDINPLGISLSRELAFKTVVDLKQRNPLVIFTFKY